MSLTFNATFGLMPGYGEFTYQPHHHDAVVGSAVRAAIATADHVTHYAYGRTPDEQLGEVAFNIVREYRAAAQDQRPKQAEVK